MREPIDIVVDDVPSPCVRNCCLDDDDICLGCYRSLQEICSWSQSSDSQKLETLIKCRQRYRQRFEP